jgi:hypothetical protein
MSSRFERRRFRAEALRSLVTYLCEPTNPALIGEPLLRAAANHWLDALQVRVRHCIVCNVGLVDRRSVGALLMGKPADAEADAVSTAAVCSACWAADLGPDALDRAAAKVLQVAVPNGGWLDAVRR